MSKSSKIDPVSFAFGWGITSGVGWMLLCWMGARWGVGLPLIQVVSSMYHSMAPTFIGGLWGLFWGFLNFFIFSIFAAIIYNCIRCCYRHNECCDHPKCDNKHD